MGVEFTGFNLLDVYAKTNPNKIHNKYGKEFIVKVNFSTPEGEDQPRIERHVLKNTDFEAP